jgi:hypothetical protein
VGFSPGDRVLYRGIHVTDSGAEPPVVADVKPAIVAQDTPELVAFWVLAGTPTKLSRPLDPGQPKPWFRGEWEFVDAVWSRWNALFLIQPEAWHATWVWWTPEWEFLGWYVNMQESLVRRLEGFDHRDLQLDIVVQPDRTWRWKDETTSPAQSRPASSPRRLRPGLAQRLSGSSRSSRRGATRSRQRSPPCARMPPGLPCLNPDARVRLSGCPTPPAPSASDR